MKLIWEIVKLSLQRQLSYRTATIAGFITNFFFGIIRATIFVALYNLQSEVEGISVEGAVTYAAIGQSVIGYLSLFHWYDLMNTIYTGDIASDLLKPINYFSFWMAQDLGRAIIQLILRGVILLAAFSLIYDLYWPKSLTTIFALIISIFLSWLVSFSWRFLINLSAFWTPNARGILRFSFVLSWFFSGFLMPLRFFPDWIIKLSYITPFPHMFNTVIEIFLDLLVGPALYQALCNQLLWALVLILAGQVVLRIGIKRLVILGG